jgi:parallel beta-helix repeat protein
MKRGVWTLALLAALPISLGGGSPARATPAQTKINKCPFNITAPGAYVLQKDLSCAGTAITISASNVDLNLGGQTLSGNGLGDGIYVQGQSNISIHDGAIQSFVNGIELQQTLASKITNVRVSQHTQWGITGRGATEGLTVRGCTAIRNGNWGIWLDNDSRANTVTGNTATANGAGIGLGGGTFGNSVTNNIASGNGCQGIGLFGATGNTVAGNTTDRNGCHGIAVNNGSSGNTVTGNSATGNGGQGISLIFGSFQNTIQKNTVSGSYQGIFLGNGSATGNIVEGNTATLNIRGIDLDQGANSNSIHDNTATNNRDWDLGDQNFGCDSNSWFNNTFVTDNVAGASDGGPGVGCIQ